jgi:hypothetical protein
MMLQQLLIFYGRPDFGDQEDLAYIEAYPDAIVANVPGKDYSDFPILLHQAFCRDARTNIVDGSLTTDTQSKIVFASREEAEQYLPRQFPNHPLAYCQSRKRGGCAAFWQA